MRVAHPGDVHWLERAERECFPDPWPAQLIAAELNVAQGADLSEVEDALSDPPRPALAWERDGRYMATADLCEDSRDVGVGDTPQEAVREALMKRGVGAGRIQATGYGEARPIADNGTEDGREANRRIEFKLLLPESEDESADVGEDTQE
mgnify:CR=1 FL=1